MNFDSPVRCCTPPSEGHGAPSPYSEELLFRVGASLRPPALCFTLTSGQETA
jgi:hypothetical protein